MTHRITVVASVKSNLHLLPTFGGGGCLGRLPVAGTVWNKAAHRPGHMFDTTTLICDFSSLLPCFYLFIILKQEIALKDAIVDSLMHASRRCHAQTSTLRKRRYRDYYLFGHIKSGAEIGF